MQLGALYKALRESLSESDARYVIRKRLQLSQTDIISRPEQEVNASEALNDLEAVQSGVPLARIYGEAEFWSLPFKVSEGTLEPRQDTETLIEAVINRYKDAPPKTILDLGTGTGCILIALLREFPDAKGVGVDMSIDSITTAKQNAKQNGVENRIRFIQSDWAESIAESFDLVVSNPPYICESVVKNLDESVKDHDPILALDGGMDGLQAYKKIFSELFSILNLGGRAFFEIGFDQSESVMRLSRESRFLPVRTYADLAGHTRVIEVVPQNPNGDK